MKVKHDRSRDKFAHDDGLSGWNRIVAALIVAAAAVGTLMITGSLETTTAVVVLVLVPLVDRN
jgi:uncharacterized membrane protein YgaE (UPF0421/DUF939 family)